MKRRGGQNRPIAAKMTTFGQVVCKGALRNGPLLKRTPMAKQIGELKITGTIDDVTYYKMEGAYYARMKSSLDGKRVKKDPRFKRTMEWAERLATASRLASKVYRSLPRDEQEYALFCRLKSLAIRGLKEGRCEKEVGTRIWEDVKDLREQGEQRDSQGEAAAGRSCGRKETIRKRAATGGMLTSSARHFVAFLYSVSGASLTNMNRR